MKALVTFVVGEKYFKDYNQFRTSHESYCERHGWKHIVLTDPIDSDSDRKSIIAQKILVGTFDEYETVVWVDSDVWITCTCPEIETKDPTKIGVCDQKPFHNDILFSEVKRHRNWIGTNKDYYDRYGLPEGLSDFNAGLMVFHPKYHSSYLRDLYNGLAEFIRSVPVSDPVTGVFMHYDQPYLGYHFCKSDNYEILDWRHNTVWPVYRCVLAEPYSNQRELIRPLKRLMDVAWSVHFTDHEDTDVLEVVKRIITCKDMNVEIDRIETFIDPFFRLHDFKTITVPNELYNSMRFSQTGFVIPKNVIRKNGKND